MSSFARLSAGSFLTLALLLGTGCSTGGRVVAPGVLSGGGETYTTFAADVNEVTDIAAATMREFGVQGVTSLATDTEGEAGGFYGLEKVRVSVRQDGTHTTRLAVSNQAGYLFARELVTRINDAVYAESPAVSDEGATVYEEIVVASDDRTTTSSSAPVNPLAR